MESGHSAGGTRGFPGNVGDAHDDLIQTNRRTRPLYADSCDQKVIDHFFASENLEPTIVMDTENVEIIKAMVKTGLGVGFVPYQAVAREVRAGQLFCARIEGHELVRETGWVYARANRVPRAIHELLQSFQAISGKLRLAPPGGKGRPAPPA